MLCYTCEIATRFSLFIYSLFIKLNLNSINISEIVEKTKTQLQKDKTLMTALKMSIELILGVVVMLACKLELNSQNSSIPPPKGIRML